MNHLVNHPVDHPADHVDPSDDLCFRTAYELATALARREVSAREVVTAHLERIERVNPTVNAIVTLVADRALEEAAEADERLAAGQKVGPLHGLPVAHKDLHDTAGIRTTYGSPIFADHVPDRDHLVVRRLKQAGAITLGKTNVPELGLGSHTVNPVFGATRNPYDLSRSAGGSSGGAGAALACGMQPIADGSDTGGSLRNPASFNNVVGLRPSPGRVPSWPDKAPWGQLSVKGPMARTVADVALALSVLAGPDPRDPRSLETPGSTFVWQLNGDIWGSKIAWSPDLGGAVPVDPEVGDALRSAVEVFASLGCEVEEACPDLSGADEVFLTQRAWQVELSYGALLDEHRHRIAPDVVWNIEEGRKLAGPDLGRAQALHGALYHRVREFFETYDLLLLPVSQVAPFDIDLPYPTVVDGIPMETYLDWMRSAYLISVTGCPALSVPGGFTPQGLPIGLQVVGPHRQDWTVLQAGYAFEQATRFGERRPPVVPRG
ncbi:amidase [Streptomyces ipomoeae]|uniref:amidase n=2 Tax=Streptomyces ipomoeae TaxID=103232 RepID=UPI001146ADC8|nr:amidase [Streptomyces ipomoeae]MDX2937582.1 amidase [Streptomyces ipomoeae]TQE29171.1 amidase [Streptomyces ipomoeae]